MANQITIREGMQVYGADNQLFGKVERVTSNQFYVSGKAFPLSAISRLDGNMAYMTGSNQSGEMVLPVTEEELQVGKREVESGGARVTTQVTEKPVEAQVTLHQEEVKVERHAVNRPVNEADMAAFKEGVIEVTTTEEQAVVSKQARVVEEVVVNKTAQDRTETIHDTVRRSNVEVEQIATPMTTSTQTTTTTTSGMSNFDADFRSNFQSNYASSGSTYEQYAPVYQYGADLHNDPRYAKGDWNKVSSQVRQDWEQRNPGTWEQFKDTIKFAWDKVRG